jgi:hypothetical protein
MGVMHVAINVIQSAPVSSNCGHLEMFCQMLRQQCGYTCHMCNGTSYGLPAAATGNCTVQLTPQLPQPLQGASIVYALLSAKPEYNDKVSVALHMGPVAFITKIAPGVVRDQATVGNDMVRRDAPWLGSPAFL